MFLNKGSTYMLGSWNEIYSTCNGKRVPHQNYLTRPENVNATSDFSFPSLQ